MRTIKDNFPFVQMPEASVEPAPEITLVIGAYSRRVIRLKKGEGAYLIPFELAFEYEHPQVDQVEKSA